MIENYDGVVKDEQEGAPPLGTLTKYAVALITDNGEPPDAVEAQRLSSEQGATAGEGGGPPAAAAAHNLPQDLRRADNGGGGPPPAATLSQDLPVSNDWDLYVEMEVRQRAVQEGKDVKKFLEGSPVFDTQSLQRIENCETRLGQAIRTVEGAGPHDNVSAAAAFIQRASTLLYKMENYYRFLHEWDDDRVLRLFLKFLERDNI